MLRLIVNALPYCNRFAYTGEPFDPVHWLV
jgi:hypothetical protein